jgi:hypothetical protein
MAGENKGLKADIKGVSVKNPHPYEFDSRLPHQEPINRP